MPERIHRPPDQHTPVDLDANASAPEVLARAAVDYRLAQGRRTRLSGEDRVHGNVTGSAA